MLTLPEIQALTAKVIDLYKKSKSKKDAGLPEYHNTYCHSIEMKEAIEVHAIPGKKPDKLVAERAPNQTDKEFKYAMANYQQTTMPVFLDTVHTMQRAFADNNWSIDYRQGEDKDNDIRIYVEEAIVNTPLKMTLESFYFQVVPSLKLIDPMGCIGIKPWFIPTVQLDSGETVIDGQTMYEPIPVYYPCESIMAYQESKYYLFLSEEKSWVEWGNYREQTGLVFEFYDESAIWRIEQTGKKIDYTFSYTVYYTHNLGYTPVDRLKGIPAYYCGEIIFQSLFLFATPMLNDVVLDSIMLRSIKAASVFPYRVMTGNICTNTMTIHGEIQNCDGTGWFRDFTTGVSICCPKCLGTGSTDRISPHGVLLLKPETAFKEGELKASQPAMYYVEPGPEAYTFLRNEIETNTNKARQVLHLRNIPNTRIQGNPQQTATEVVVDEKALFSTVKMFSDQEFDLYENSINSIGLMRFGDRFEKPIIVRSTTFDFTTEFEYMERISAAIKNGLPAFVVYEIVYRYIQTMFYNETDRAAAFDLLVTTDLLLVTPFDQINLDIARGSTAQWQLVLHESGIQLIRNLQLLNPKFFEQDLQAQADQLIAEAKRHTESNKAAMPSANSNIVDATLRLAQTGT